MSTTRRRFVAMAASAAVVVGVLVAILLFGVRDVPSYPALADAPDPSITGWIAYGVAGDDKVGNLCIDVVPAGGGVPRRITCSAGGPFSWSSDGMLQVYRVPLLTAPYTVTRYDPATGASLGDASTASAPYANSYGSPRRADGAVVAVSRDRVIVGMGTGSITILRVADAPDDYAFLLGRWSPDGRWVLVQDSERRLLVVAADGTGSARVVAADLTYSFDWWQPTS